MALTELSFDLPVEHMGNVFGQFDEYMKKIERALNVTVVVRSGQMKLLGEGDAVKSASHVFEQLLTLSKRGNTITVQNVDYVLELARESKETAIVDIDGDLICHTTNGKPIKPKTLGQKAYVYQPATYTKTEAEVLAKEGWDAFLEKFTQKGIPIIVKNIKIKTEKKNCVIRGSIQAEVPIGKYAPTERITLPEQPQSDEPSE